MNRNILFFIIKLLISIALISWLVMKVDLSQVGTRLSDLNWWYVFFAALCFLALLVNNTLRWNTILSAIDQSYPFSLIIKTQFIGSFFNQALPSFIGGDALRVYILHKAGATLKVSINGIILERVITVAGLIFLVTLVQPFMALPAEMARAQYIFPALSMLAVLGIIVMIQFDRVPERFNKWRIIQGLSNLAGDAKTLFLSKSKAGRSLFFGISGNVLLCLFMYQCAHALGVELGLKEALVLVPPAILFSTLPISIAGWGVRESAMVTTLAMAGIPEIDAFTVSILFGLLMAAFSLPGGLIWLVHRNKS